MGDFKRLVAWQKAHAFELAVHAAFKGRRLAAAPGFRGQLLRAVGSITKLTTLSAAQLSQLFDKRIAKKIIRDLKNFRSGGAKDVLPLIVPIRFHDENGSADDLRPIATRQAH